MRRQDRTAAEATFAALATGSPAKEALDQLLYEVEDNADVHRVVLAYRSYDMLGLLGKEHAHVMLRQSLRYCLQNDASPPGRIAPGYCRDILPKLLDAHRLLGKSAGKKRLSDKELARLSEAIFRRYPRRRRPAWRLRRWRTASLPTRSPRRLPWPPASLCYVTRAAPKNQTSPGKPLGSIHGDSVGVHACDSANAWRNLARASNWRNTAACLILGAFQVALDRIERGGDFLRWQAYPRTDHLQKVIVRDAASLLAEAKTAIENKDQASAAAAMHLYASAGHAGGPAFSLLLRYAVSEDGALHAEKFYHTASEEYERSRPAFRGRYLVALARVTASAYGQPAPGILEARRLLGV